MGLGVPELAIILVIIIVLFGSSRLPQIGKGLGEGITNFKKGLKGQEELPESKEDSSTSSKD